MCSFSLELAITTSSWIGCHCAICEERRFLAKNNLLLFDSQTILMLWGGWHLTRGRWTQLAAHLCLNHCHGRARIQSYMVASFRESWAYHHETLLRAYILNYSLSAGPQALKSTVMPLRGSPIIPRLGRLLICSNILYIFVVYFYIFEYSLFYAFWTNWTNIFIMKIWRYAVPVRPWESIEMPA